ncbi:MAG: PhzF family phenazine biosynthesis protein [Myxococcota bacterium]|jgi:PhzF family phenazine biosynthesis protein|nr:PhzF family phenazine biosynthesis protein [Myxococcota bacterium]
MRQRPFKQVDVFSPLCYLGNPLAVVLDGTELSTQAMQQFTNWSNLSEATVRLPPTPQGAAAGADYRVRIFCAGGELPFAGHPTLGTCHAWLEAGGQPRGAHVVQECGAGLVKIRRLGKSLAFAAPPLIRSGPLDESDVALLARGLGLERQDIVAHAWCDNGPGWRGLLLRSAEQVLAVKPDPTLLSALDVGIIGPYPQRDASSEQRDAPLFEVRAFFPGQHGLAEDPVTGSLNAALGQWLIGAGLAPPHYLASQGTALGRQGRVLVERDDAAVWVGGAVVTCVDGVVMV